MCCRTPTTEQFGPVPVTDDSRREVHERPVVYGRLSTCSGSSLSAARRVGDHGRQDLGLRAAHNHGYRLDVGLAAEVGGLAGALA